ncbi:PREDICTED: transcription factor bHLH115-like [Ipomoea nil]|uniref:transcription factor bHLH115-like n=1 Tax=Ipomoea nil TaxID=35883 RepID=UPI0009018069|nr:PREDICTED: transcription factor bHLH115-like [Ipomoea nil]XP_019192949.1 PREDICTED: transcription factor bHLH115-like [Ipomoea nil]
METDSNWLIDYEMMDDISSAVSATASFPSSATIDFSWVSQTVNYSSTATGSTACQFEDTEVCKEAGSRKRLKLETCIPSGSKACREKMRRDLINERFLELSSILEPTRPPKTDKIAILSGAVRVVTSLRTEIEKLKESNLELVEKIHELKAEKMELRDEKQKLKEDKMKLEQQVNGAAMFAKPASFSHPILNLEGQVAAGKKMMPVVGYPGFAMWQFMQPTIVDTSQDHVLHPPVA